MQFCSANAIVQNILPGWQTPSLETSSAVRRIGMGRHGQNPEVPSGLFKDGWGPLVKWRRDLWPSWWMIYCFADIWQGIYNNITVKPSKNISRLWIMYFSDFKSKPRSYICTPKMRCLSLVCWFPHGLANFGENFVVVCKLSASDLPWRLPHASNLGCHITRAQLPHEKRCGRYSTLSERVQHGTLQKICRNLGASSRGPGLWSETIKWYKMTTILYPAKTIGANSVTMGFRLFSVDLNSKQAHLSAALRWWGCFPRFDGANVFHVLMDALNKDELNISTLQPWYVEFEKSSIW